MNDLINDGIALISESQAITGNKIDTTTIVCVVGDKSYQLKIEAIASNSGARVKFVDGEFSILISSSCGMGLIDSMDAYRSLRTDERREAFLRLITDLPPLLDRLASELMLEANLFCSLCEIATNPR